MTIQEVRDNIESYVGENRGIVLGATVQLLSPVSQETLQEFQWEWDESRSFEEFVEAQNKKIVMCIDIELADMGAATRAALGMDLLTPETVVLVSEVAPIKEQP